MGNDLPDHARTSSVIDWTTESSWARICAATVATIEGGKGARPQTHRRGDRCDWGRRSPCCCGQHLAPGIDRFGATANGNARRTTQLIDCRAPSRDEQPIDCRAPGPPRVVNGWPRTRVGPAGVYSWSGDRAWMHNATDKCVGVEMTFSSVVIDLASRPTTGAETRSEWISEEASIGPDGVRTELWTADFGNRRVTIKVEAQPDTTPAELAEAHVVIKSIRSEPTDTSAFRLTFTLPDGWDSG